MSELAHTDKQAVIDAAIPLLQQGVSTDEIVEKLNLPFTGRTLRNWLIDKPEAQQARAAFVAGKLEESMEEIEKSADAFPLARAREKFKSWAWIAERRLPHLYGQKVGQLGGIQVNVVIGNPLQSVAPMPKCDATSEHNVIIDQQDAGK